MTTKAATNSRGESRTGVPSLNMHMATLGELEAVIDAGAQQACEVGAALTAIRDRKLYKDTHATFEAYVRERFGYARSHGYRLMAAARGVSRGRQEEYATARQARAAHRAAAAEARAEHREAFRAKVAAMTDEDRAAQVAAWEAADKAFRDAVRVEFETDDRDKERARAATSAREAAGKARDADGGREWRAEKMAQMSASSRARAQMARALRDAKYDDRWVKSNLVKIAKARALLDWSAALDDAAGRQKYGPEHALFTVRQLDLLSADIAALRAKLEPLGASIEHAA